MAMGNTTSICKVTAPISNRLLLIRGYSTAKRNAGNVHSRAASYNIRSLPVGAEAVGPYRKTPPYRSVRWTSHTCKK